MTASARPGALADARSIAPVPGGFSLFYVAILRLQNINLSCSPDPSLTLA